MTAVGADGAGFPDLCLVRGDSLEFAELKVGRNKVSPSQQVWIDLLGAHVWRPEDWPKIQDVLA